MSLKKAVMISMMNPSVKYFEHGGKIIFIESSRELIHIDVYDKDGKTPADLSGAKAFFHLMEFSTRSNIWSKECFPVYDPNAGIPDIDYPCTVPVPFASSDTANLEGHYVGQLELIDHHGSSKFPFQIEIIIGKKAG